MAYRMERLAAVTREVVSDAISNRLSDPRISRFTSVTRVHVSKDLLIADIYVSVMGSDSQARTTMKGLESARGLIQTRLARQLSIRQCPELRFHLDKGLKIGNETIQELDRVMSESREAEEAMPGCGPEDSPDAPGDTSDRHEPE